MSKARVVVLEVVSGNLTVTAAARTCGLSRRHIYRHLARFHQGGLDAGPLTLQSHLANNAAYPSRRPPRSDASCTATA